MKSVKLNACNPEINWNKVQLLQGDSGNRIVMSTGKHNDGNFSGTVVFSDGSHHYKTGVYSECWVKAAFKPFNGRIELSND